MKPIREKVKLPYILITVIQSISVCLHVCLCPLNIYTRANANGFMHNLLVVTANTLLGRRKVDD